MLALPLPFHPSPLRFQVSGYRFQGPPTPPKPEGRGPDTCNLKPWEAGRGAARHRSLRRAVIGSTPAARLAGR